MKKILLVSALLAIALFIMSGCGSSADEPPVVTAGGHLEIPTSEISETAAFFPVIVDDILMEVIAVQGSGDAIHVAFNTCENCHASGRGYYVQQGNVLICQQCNMQFYIDEIGLTSGGCQPISIITANRASFGDFVRVSYQTLSDNTHWFLRWRIEA
ncbi:MAG: DUF2318 domain-containing protein [Defluviitaleaceae bacterium]|nr:DUF2318 domain-containing protein [Defluviitaleaceae bacterium]